MTNQFHCGMSLTLGSERMCSSYAKTYCHSHGGCVCCTYKQWWIGSNSKDVIHCIGTELEFCFSAMHAGTVGAIRGGVYSILLIGQESLSSSRSVLWYCREL
uniref:Uncharacterized protein n=1 Tax=Anguilla anguilla TaxID=7936 RepID=A0A0E9X7L7_ANGAN